MKLGIFETVHFEVAHAVIELFDNGSNELTIFIYKDAYRQLAYLLGDKLHSYTWIIKSEEESRRVFIYRIYREVRRRRITLLYLNTIADNFILYALMVKRLPAIRIVMTIHAINEYFAARPVWSIRGLARYTGKKWLIKLVKEFNVISFGMAGYLSGKLPPGKKCHCLPGNLFRERPPRKALVNEPMVIVVPGTIDSRRRNYALVFELLQRCQAESLPVKIILLGGIPSECSEQLLAQCRFYSRAFPGLVFYETEMAEQPEFDRQMAAAHMVLIPSVIHTVLADGIGEIYGKTICSGSVFDVVRHAKPFLVPSGLEVDPFLENSCLRFNGVNEIVLHLKDLAGSTQSYACLCEKALLGSLNYTADAVRKRNPQLFAIGKG